MPSGMPQPGVMAMNFMRSSAMSSSRREPRGKAGASMIKLLVKGEIRRLSRPWRDHSRSGADGGERVARSTTSTPTAEDWKRLLIAGFILAVGLSHYIVIGCNQGWRPGIREFTNAAWPELKYDWRNG